MLWYVIQTYTGKEEKLVEMVRRVVPRNLYGKCFVAYHEQLRRRQQENQLHIERIFPGYVFITSDQPEPLFLCLKKVPAMSKLISDGDYTFLPLAAEEMNVLEEILDETCVIRLSYIETDGKDHVSYISGPLEACRQRVESYQFRKRFATIQLTLAGEKKNVRLGIILPDDVSRELAYGKVEAPIQVPERYRIPVPVPQVIPEFEPGDAVTVINGIFAGMPAMVYQVRKQNVKIGVHFFSRDMTMEVPAVFLKKTVA